VRCGCCGAGGVHAAAKANPTEIANCAVSLILSPLSKPYQVVSIAHYIRDLWVSLAISKGGCLHPAQTMSRSTHPTASMLPNSPLIKNPSCNLSQTPSHCHCKPCAVSWSIFFQAHVNNSRHGMTTVTHSACAAAPRLSLLAARLRD
jgi:hypothetical protein